MFPVFFPTVGGQLGHKKSTTHSVNHPSTDLFDIDLFGSDDKTSANDSLNIGTQQHDGVPTITNKIQSTVLTRSDQSSPQNGTASGTLLLPSQGILVSQQKGIPGLILSKCFPIISTTNSEHIRGEMKNDKPVIRFKSFGWLKSPNHDFAKVNIHLLIKRKGTEESIVSFLGDEQFSLDEHRNKNAHTSDTVCLSLEMKGAAENVDTVDGNFDQDSHSLSEPLTHTRGNVLMEATVDTTDYVQFNDRKNHEEWLSEIMKLCDKNVFGYSPIEYCIAMNDRDGLKNVVDSNRFDLNKNDNLGYSKEFWCYYYLNWKALQLIRSKKLEMGVLQQEETFMVDDLEQSWFELGASPSNSLSLVAAASTIGIENASHISIGPYLTSHSLNASWFKNCQHLKLDRVKLGERTSSVDVWKITGSGENSSQLKFISINLSSGDSNVFEHHSI